MRGGGQRPFINLIKKMRKWLRRSSLMLTEMLKKRHGGKFLSRNCQSCINANLFTQKNVQIANDYFFATKCVKTGLCAHSSNQWMTYFFQLQIFSPVFKYLILCAGVLGKLTPFKWAVLKDLPQTSK